MFILLTTKHLVIEIWQNCVSCYYTSLHLPHPIFLSSETVITLLWHCFHIHIHVPSLFPIETTWIRNTKYCWYSYPYQVRIIFFSVSPSANPPQKITFGASVNPGLLMCLVWFIHSLWLWTFTTTTSSSFPSIYPCCSCSLQTSGRRYSSSFWLGPRKFINAACYWSIFLEELLTSPKP